jgi:hypothetical protein
MNSFFIKDFLFLINPDLKRIARQSRGEITLQELESEVIIAISDFEVKKERDFDHLSFTDQDWLLKGLYFKFVKGIDHKLKYAQRIDQELETADGSTWLTELPAEETSDPLQFALFEENHREIEQLLADSYSEAKAYVVSFDHFNHDKTKLSTFLNITSNTLNNRVNRALSHVRLQPSIFDRIETIDKSFFPLSGVKKNKKPPNSNTFNPQFLNFNWSFLYATCNSRSVSVADHFPQDTS